MQLVDSASVSATTNCAMTAATLVDGVTSVSTDSAWDQECIVTLELDAALFQAIQANLRRDIPVREIDANINDPEFARAVASELLNMIEGQKSVSSALSV